MPRRQAVLGSNQVCEATPSSDSNTCACTASDSGILDRRRQAHNASCLPQNTSNPDHQSNSHACEVKSVLGMRVKRRAPDACGNMLVNGTSEGRGLERFRLRLLAMPEGIFAI